MYNREYFKESSMNNCINCDELDILKQKHDRLAELLTYEEVLLDKKLFLNLEKQLIALRPIVNKYIKFLELEKHLTELEEILLSAKNEDLVIFEEEKNKTIQEKQNLEFEVLREFNNYNATMQSCVVEIVESKDTTSHKMAQFIEDSYLKYCELGGLECKKINNKLIISGLNAKNIFDTVKGVHVGKFDFGEEVVQVFVYENIEVKTFDIKDVEISACRSSGAGGQHINTTDSAIKVTHIPTNISCICQDERSQIQNKQQALENLKEKVNAFYNNQVEKKLENDKKQQLKAIKLNKAVRMYNKKENIVMVEEKTLRLSDFVEGKFI